MDNRLRPYLMAAVVSNIADRQGDISNEYLDRDAIYQIIAVLADGKMPKDEIGWIFSELQDIGIITSIDDDLAGSFYRLVTRPAVDIVNNSGKISGSLVYKYRTVGKKFLDSAINQLGSDVNSEIDRVPLDGRPSAPASDRFVQLNHNQSSQFDEQISNLVEELESRDNGDPDNPGLRERLLGQLKAGRELVRAGEFRAYLLYEVLVRALNELIEKYANETVRALANALLGAITSQILVGQ